MTDIKIPTIGESITEVTLLKWVKKEGDWVERDEVIAELESEKATFEVNAEKAGVLKPLAAEGDTLNIGAVVAQIDETAAKPAAAPGPAEAPKADKPQTTNDKPQTTPAPAPQPQTTNDKQQT